MPSEPLKTDPPSPPEVVGGQIPLEQMAQLLATTLRQPREPVASIERGRKLGAQNYDGFGDPEKASSWLEGNERVYRVMQCTGLQEADVAPEVMTGIIQIFYSDAYVLIDPGATHSFISGKFISQVNIQI